MRAHVAFTPALLKLV